MSLENTDAVGKEKCRVRATELSLTVKAGSQHNGGNARPVKGGQSDNNIRELAVLDFVHKHPSINHLGDSPANVAKAIDEFKTTRERLMTIGPAKAEYMINRLKQLPPGPKVFIEFGAYVGYSAVILAGALRDHNQGYPVRYYSLEINPVNAAITQSAVELAGLKSVVDVIVGPAGESLRRLVKAGKLSKGQVHSILLDHFKDVYLPDMIVVEELELLSKDAIVFADNCGPALRRGDEVHDIDSPIIEYVEYVKKGYKTELVDFGQDAVAVSEPAQ